MKRGLNIFDILKYTFLTIFAGVCLYPLLMVILGSFRKNMEILKNPFGLPAQFMFENYIKAWINGKLYSLYQNSFVVTILSVIILVILASMLGFVLTWSDFGFKKLLYSVIIVGMTIPSQVGIIPLYLQMVKFRLADSLAGLIIVYVVNYLSYTTFVMHGFIKDVSKEIQEAAIVDGCSTFGLYARIIMPLSTAVITTVVIFNLMFVWNDMFFSMVMMSTPTKKTLMIGLLGFVGQYQSDYATMFAGIVLVSLPMLILFLVLQKRFIEGVTSGAVKG